MTPTELLDLQEKVVLGPFADAVYKQKYAMTKPNGEAETWPETASRVATEVLGALGYDPDSDEVLKLTQLITERKFIPGGRYLYAAGRPYHQTNNCYLLKAVDSREGWADLLKKSALILQTGGGVGIEYSDIRPCGSPIKKTGGVASGPLPLMQMVNEIGRGVMQGGSRRSAIIGILKWDHADIASFISMKDWSDDVKALKAKDFNFPATLDMTNISVRLDDEFFEAFNDQNHPKHKLAHTVYTGTVANMVTTGEPGFSVDVGEDSEDILRNPCSEVVSADDSDVCCLGSINLAGVDSPEELDDIVSWGTLFLLAGTVYSDMPYEQVGEIREKNRRLGLGIMGVHEWLLKRGYRYEPNDELAEWLSVYATSTEKAHRWAEEHELSLPVKTRAIAPTGTLSILAETTSGIEPIFCAAYKRRFKTSSPDGKDITNYQYVLDPTAKRLVSQGVDPDNIEDAYELSYNVERRIRMQAFINQYVDMAISSTINLPYQITDEFEAKLFGDSLMKYLPNLRGVTCYPDGCRPGQPIEAVPYQLAANQEGVTLQDNNDLACKSGVCGA